MERNHTVQPHNPQSKNSAHFVQRIWGIHIHT